MKTDGRDPKGVPPELMALRRAALLSVVEGRATPVQAARDLIKATGTPGAATAAHLTRLARALTAIRAGATVPSIIADYPAKHPQTIYMALRRYGISAATERPRLAARHALRTRGIYLGSPDDLLRGMTRPQSDWVLAQIPKGTTLIELLRALLLDLYYEEHPDAG